jgi:hypothetical protein
VPRALFLLVSNSELSESANDSSPHVMINYRGADSGNAMNWHLVATSLTTPGSRRENASPPGYGSAATRPGATVARSARPVDHLRRAILLNSVSVMCISIIRWTSSSNSRRPVQVRWRTLRDLSNRGHGLRSCGGSTGRMRKQSTSGNRKGRAVGGPSLAGQDRRRVRLR